MAANNQAGLSTGGGLTLVNDFLMTGCRKDLLCKDHQTTDRTMLAFGSAILGTGGSLGSIDHFSMVQSLTRYIGGVITLFAVFISIPACLATGGCFPLHLNNIMQNNACIGGNIQIKSIRLAAGQTEQFSRCRPVKISCIVIGICRRNAIFRNHRNQNIASSNNTGIYTILTGSHQNFFQKCAIIVDLGNFIFRRSIHPGKTIGGIGRSCGIFNLVAGFYIIDFQSGSYTDGIHLNIVKIDCICNLAGCNTDHRSRDGAHIQRNIFSAAQQFAVCIIQIIACLEGPLCSEVKLSLHRVGVACS